MVKDLEGRLKNRVSEYQASSLWKERVDHADLVCKEVDDFINFINNAINPPTKSQKPYKALVRFINGKYWIHINNPLLNGHSVVAYQSDNVEADLKRIERECGGLISLVFC